MKRFLLFVIPLLFAFVAVAVGSPHAAHAAALAVGDSVTAVAQHAATHITPFLNPNALVLLGAGGVMGTLASAAADLDTYPARKTVQYQYNLLALWTSYINRNRVISSTAATLPVLAIGSTTTKVKTTNASVVALSGVATALAATDNAWTLTGGNLATGFVRKYLMLWNGAVFTVVQSDQDAAVGSPSTAFTFSNPNIPADGVVIVGVITVSNASGAAFIPATTALSAAGVTTTYMDGCGDDSVLPFAKVL